MQRTRNDIRCVDLSVRHIVTIVLASGEREDRSERNDADAERTYRPVPAERNRHRPEPDRQRGGDCDVRRGGGHVGAKVALSG